MQPSRLLKYLLDIQSAISEIEQVRKLCQNDFAQFEQNFMAVRTN